MIEDSKHRLRASTFVLTKAHMYLGVCVHTHKLEPPSFGLGFFFSHRDPSASVSGRWNENCAPLLPCFFLSRAREKAQSLTHDWQAPHH